MVALASLTNSIHADIYLYVDEEGIYNFSDQPATKEYELFIKERRPKASAAGNSAKYDEYIEAASRKHGVDAPLLKAVMMAESNFNPRAVSKKGALGLMQIMPQNLRKLKITNPFDPKENIMAGAQYLKELLNRFNGKLPLAVAAYNAGPNSVERLNRIPPIKETEKYVKKVMKYYHHFKGDRE